MNHIILAISNPVISAGMASILHNGLSHSIETVTSLLQLRTACNKHDDAIVVLCSRLGADGTVEAWRRLARRYKELRLILWGKGYQDILDFQCSVPQVDGYLLESSSGHELKDAVMALKNGGVYVAAPVARYFVQNPHLNHNTPIINKLSERELQVAQMISRGLKVSEIANYLNISSKTINTFRYRIFSKLGVQGDVQLAHLAINSGLVEVNQLRNYDSDF
ncbi:response regulator transcription factor [Idiomarina seosinensis]|uniref:LuxR C-terminal-related transcriptional regulator n=1 Tax=Idiomarina seosinensis TaxID=281739 RepID=UPI00384FE024